MPKSKSEIWEYYTLVERTEEAGNTHLHTDQYRCRFCGAIRARNASRFIIHIAKECLKAPHDVRMRVAEELARKSQAGSPATHPYLSPDVLVAGSGRSSGARAPWPRGLSYFSPRLDTSPSSPQFLTRPASASARGAPGHVRLPPIQALLQKSSPVLPSLSMRPLSPLEPYGYGAKPPHTGNHVPRLANSPSPGRPYTPDSVLVTSTDTSPTPPLRGPTVWGNDAYNNHSNGGSRGQYYHGASSTAAMLDLDMYDKALGRAFAASQVPLEHIEKSEWVELFYLINPRYRLPRAHGLYDALRK
ncbi:hypothetical protein H4R35_001996 [Dimargaris xerosporica]|nr:hypothetical protein H4R35_001996 [Dimargaris xerosporica]